MDSWHHCFKVLRLLQKKYKILLNSHLMTRLWHIKIFASLEILLLGYCDILMHLKMSISIYDQFVSEPDIPTSITLGLMYHFKCSSLFHHCIFRDYYPGFIGAHEIHIKDLTGIKNYKKLMSPLNSPLSICSEYVNSSKLKYLPFFVQNYGLKDDRCQHWQVSRITENYCHQWIQHLQIVHYAKFRGKWFTSFPVPLFKDSQLFLISIIIPWKSISTIFGTSFKTRIFFVFYFSATIFTLVLSSLSFGMCLMSLV